MRNAKGRWNGGLEKTLRVMVNEGKLTQPEMAEKFGVKIECIRARIHRMRQKDSQKPKPEPYWTRFKGDKNMRHKDEQRTRVDYDY